MTLFPRKRVLKNPDVGVSVLNPQPTLAPRRITRNTRHSQSTVLDHKLSSRCFNTNDFLVQHNRAYAHPSAILVLSCFPFFVVTFGDRHPQFLPRPPMILRVYVKIVDPGSDGKRHCCPRLRFEHGKRLSQFLPPPRAFRFF